MEHPYIDTNIEILTQTGNSAFIHLLQLHLDIQLTFQDQQFHVIRDL